MLNFKIKISLINQIRMYFLKNIILQNYFITRSIILNTNRNSHTLTRIFSNTCFLRTNFSYILQENLILKCLSDGSNYKSPVNAGKSFKPQPIPVSKQNQHLRVQVFSQTDENLGVLSLQEAKEKANLSNLKLVMIDENPSPPHAKLLSGKELHELQMKVKLAKEERNSPKVLKEKEIDINLGISDHDLEIKIKMLKNFLEKGHPVTVKIDSKIVKKREKNIPVLQDQFLKRVESLITFANVKVTKKTEERITIVLESKTGETKV